MKRIVGFATALSGAAILSLSGSAAALHYTEGGSPPSCNSTCQNPSPKFACTALDVKNVSRTQFDFTANASVTNANVTSYVFTTKDASGKVLDTKTVSTSALSAGYSFNQDNAGNYRVSAVVNTDKGSTNASDCTKCITVKEQPPAPKPKFACTGLDFNEASGTQFDFTAHGSAQDAVIASYGFVAKNANGDVVDTKTVTTAATQASYTFNQTNPGNYSISAVVNTDKGSTNASDCTKTVTVKEQPATPVTPVVLPAHTAPLPNTGPGDVLGLFTGVSAFGTAGHYLVSRRRR